MAVRFPGTVAALERTSRGPEPIALTMCYSHALFIINQDTETKKKLRTCEKYVESSNTIDV